MTRLIGLSLITLAALFTAISPYFADWNDTHIYNPNWPAHAKFHNGQTMALGAICGLIAIGFAWLPKRHSRLKVLAAALFALVYWVAQAFAGLFPGASYVDPEFSAVFPKVLGVLAPQQILQIMCLLVVCFGGFLAWPRAEPAA